MKLKQISNLVFIALTQLNICPFCAFFFKKHYNKFQQIEEKLSTDRLLTRKEQHSTLPDIRVRIFLLFSVRTRSQKTPCTFIIKVISFSVSLIKPTPLITLGHGGFHLLSRDDFRLPIWRVKWPHAKPLVPHCHSLSFYLYIKNIVSFIKNKGNKQKKQTNMKSRLKSTIYSLFRLSLYTCFTNLNHCQDFRLITRLNAHFTV